MACKRTLAEEVSLTQYSDGCFLAGLRDHGEFHFARLDIKDRIGGIPLREDGLFLREEHNLPALANGCEEGMRIEIVLVLGRSH